MYETYEVCLKAGLTAARGANKLLSILIEVVFVNDFETFWPFRLLTAAVKPGATARDGRIYPISPLRSSNSSNVLRFEGV